jgi:hypothetical protein
MSEIWTCTWTCPFCSSGGMPPEAFQRNLVVLHLVVDRAAGDAKPTGHLAQVPACIPQQPVQLFVLQLLQATPFTISARLGRDRQLCFGVLQGSGQGD